MTKLFFFPQNHRTLIISASILAVFGTTHQLYEATGGTNSLKSGIILLAASTLIVVAIYGLLLPLRWALIFSSLKSLLRNNPGIVTPKTVIVGAGPGSALAIGMLLKALQDLKRPTPRVILMGLEYSQTTGEPVILHPPLSPPALTESDTLFVFSHIGTGSALQALRTTLNLKTSPVLAFVVNPVARIKCNYSLATGDHTLLPWPKTQ
ncbi:hypothetical protein ACN28E_09505 [Archangium lansingense]|uniref:hypothetical protein n=1 Tax=Archangium lansingense TaxID=2995310 RepID=UPI003B796822